VSQAATARCSDLAQQGHQTSNTSGAIFRAWLNEQNTKAASGIKVRPRNNLGCHPAFGIVCLVCVGQMTTFSLWASRVCSGMTIGRREYSPCRCAHGCGIAEIIDLMAWACAKIPGLVSCVRDQTIASRPRAL
jgi:hypothetical protein